MRYENGFAALLVLCVGTFGIRFFDGMRNNDKLPDAQSSDVYAMASQTNENEKDILGGNITLRDFATARYERRIRSEETN